MTKKLFTNNASAKLASAVADSDVTFDVQAGQGAEFPTITGGNTFLGTLIGSGGIEIVSVTARTSDTMTVTRAQEGTVALAFAAGETFELRITAAELQSWEDFRTDAELAAIAGLTSGADKIPYFTGSGTAGLLTRDTDVSLAANSDTVLATQRAVKAYADAIIAGGVANDSITDAKLRNSGALSVIGRSANSTGDPADIATSADGDVLRRSGTTLGFGTITGTSIASSAALAGSPTTTTQSYGDSSTKVATTAFVQAALATTVDDGNSSTADTIDFSAGNVHKSTLTGTCVYTFTAPPTGSVVILKVVQGSGPYTVTWPGSVEWPASTAPTLTTTNGHVDIFTFYWDGTNYFGVVSGQDYSP